MARPTKGSGFVLGVLAASQFLMTLDSSVMNVSMSAVAADLGTTITGIQTAITLYTLVMATLMITGGKIGTIMGRRRAFAVGLVIYGCGSLVTALAPNLGVLLLGWSLLEGVGAALIMPAIVALVAGNFPPERRQPSMDLSPRPRPWRGFVRELVRAAWAWPLFGRTLTGRCSAFYRSIFDRGRTRA